MIVLDENFLEKVENGVLIFFDGLNKKEKRFSRLNFWFIKYYNFFLKVVLRNIL